MWLRYHFHQQEVQLWDILVWYNLMDIANIISLKIHHIIEIMSDS